MFSNNEFISVNFILVNSEKGHNFFLYLMKIFESGAKYKKKILIYIWLHRGDLKNFNESFFIASQNKRFFLFCIKRFQPIFTSAFLKSMLYPVKFRNRNRNNRMATSMCHATAKGFRVHYKAINNDNQKKSINVINSFKSVINDNSYSSYRL